MSENKGLTWPQIRYWLFCFALLLVGFFGTIWGGPWEATKPIVKELGPGVFTAGILASLVEPFFRREFARDAFLAAFRYVLPPEFRNEVEKIIKFDFIAEIQVWTVEIKKISDEVVCVTTKIEKTVRNKTKASKSLPCWYEVEEYKFANGSTKIVECGIKTDTDEAVSRDQIEREHHVEVKTREVSIPPDKTAQIWAEAIQYRRTNDNVWETYRTPILNPEIEVIIDDNEFSHAIQFGTYGDVSKSHYRNHYTLSGVYFPGQFMFVRWWPKSPPESDPPKST